MKRTHRYAVTSVLLGAAGAVEAAQLHVPGDYVTLQAAVQAAETGDEIIVADGTYSGAGFRNIVIPGFLFDALVIRSASGAAHTTIDLEGNGRLFDFTSNVASSIVVEGLTVTNGLAEVGGAIRCRTNGNPTIRDCTFAGCRAWSLDDPLGGGAIMVENSSPRIETSLFIGNSATGFGGAVNIGGGAIVDVVGCEFLLNDALLGGGLVYAGGEKGGSIVRCVFKENTALEPGESAGGGLVIANASTPLMEACVVVGNVSPFGAGLVIANDQSDPLILNTLFAWNHAIETDEVGQLGAGGFGGGVLVADGPRPSFVNCTFSRNFADVEGGAMVSASGADAFLANCVLWDDHAPNGAELAITDFLGFPGALRVRYSDIEGGESGVAQVPGAALDWHNSNRDVLPRFFDPDGGDFRIKAGSPIIDAGDMIAYPTSFVFDLAGAPRFHDDPGTVDTGDSGDSPAGLPMIDLGAFEFQGETSACPADFDTSNTVDMDDLMTLIVAWGACPGTCPPDLDGDNTVGFTDLVRLLSEFGPCE